LERVEKGRRLEPYYGDKIKRKKARSAPKGGRGGKDDPFKRRDSKKKKINRRQKEQSVLNEKTFHRGKGISKEHAKKGEPFLKNTKRGRGSGRKSVFRGSPRKKKTKPWIISE